MKLLLTGAYPWEQAQLDTLTALGWQIVMLPREDGVLSDDAYDADAVVCNWLFVHHDIQKFPNLRCVQLLSAGLDRVPLEDIRRRGIALYNARGVYSIPMAEFAVGGVLQFYKASRYFAENQRQRGWNKNRSLLELFGKQVLIVGAGSVGCETAKRFAAFTENVVGADLYPAEKPCFTKVYPMEQLDRLLPESDVVVLTLPLTEDTKNLFDSHRLSLMKQGAVLVNIARGGIVDEAALCEALEDQLLGAVMDVFSVEPLPESSPLWAKENLLLSPHNSFASENNRERLWTVIRSNLSEAAASFF